MSSNIVETPSPPPQPLKITKATATANDGNLPSNVLDNNQSTRWSAQGKGQKLFLDLDNAYSVTGVDISWYKGTERRSTADVFIGLVRAASLTSTLSQPTTKARFNGINGNQVTIECFGNSVNDWNSITEVKAYGLPASSTTIPPPITPTPTPEPTTGKDKYGIKMLFPSIQNGRQFYPPSTPPSGTYNATKRIGTTEMVAHGQGSVTPGTDYYKLAGSAPRMYIYDDGRNDLWKANLEITCYYNLVSKSSTSYAGFVMGGPSRHEAGGSTALAYYLKHHYSSKKFYLMKEQQHGGSGNAGYMDNASSSPTSPVDLNKWYGAKLIVRTSADGKSVKLEGYKDDTQGANGGDWKKLTEKVDNGSWNTYPPFFDGTSCMYRTDGVTDFRYKWFSVRTIPGL